MPGDPDDAQRLKRLDALRTELAVILTQMAALQDAARSTLAEFYRIGVDPSPSAVLLPRARGAVRCSVCRRGIRRPADLVIKGKAIMHVRCYDRQQGARRARTRRRKKR